MKRLFDWDTYRDIFNLPVDGMRIVEAFENDYVDYYVDEGNLFAPECWRYIQLPKIRAYYIEINKFARVFTTSLDENIENHQLNDWVTRVRKISGTDETLCKPKGKLISTIAFEKDAPYFRFESGANFFISQRHHDIKTRQQALTNTHYITYLENELGITSHMINYPRDCPLQ